MFKFPKYAEGLTQTDINFFTHYPLSAGSLLALSSDLQEKDLKDIPFFKFFLQFLKDIQHAQPLPLTQKGNLNRKFVHQLYDYRIFPSKYIDDGTVKLLKEDDWRPPHISHILAKMCGLVRKTKNKLSLTKKAENLLKDIPALYIELLKTYTGKYNWAYLGYEPEGVGQYGWAYLMYLFLKYGAKERNSNWYAQLYLDAFPEMIDRFPDSPYFSSMDRYQRCIAWRFFESFCSYFGLADIRTIKDKHDFPKEYFVKKSALADKVFNLMEY